MKLLKKKKLNETETDSNEYLFECQLIRAFINNF